MGKDFDDGESRQYPHMRRTFVMWRGALAYCQHSLCRSDCRGLTTSHVGCAGEGSGIHDHRCGEAARAVKFILKVAEREGMQVWDWRALGRLADCWISSVVGMTVARPEVRRWQRRAHAYARVSMASSDTFGP